MPVLRPGAVCILSGGLDSVCYAALLAMEYNIYTMTFSYGQRAGREVERARYFSKLLKAKDHKLVDIGFMKSLYGNTNALTDSDQELSENFQQNLVVPIRNAVFITIASAWAMSLGARVVGYGAHRGDTLNYPDCRPAFVRVLNEALNLAESDAIEAGIRQAVELRSPALANLDKASLLKKGYEVLGAKIFHTWSCYSDGKKLVQGYAHCGRCESCINRKNAFTSAQIEDKTNYASENVSKRKRGKAQRDIHER